MRYRTMIFALLAFAATLSAADPFAGTWKLNTTKTKYKVGTAPKEATLTFTEEGDNLDIALKGTTADGKPYGSHFVVPAKGGAGKIIESTYDAVTIKTINAKERETTFSKGGKPVYTAKSKLSDGDKVMTIQVKGTNILDQKVEGTNVYDKQ